MQTRQLTGISIQRLPGAVLVGMLTCASVTACRAGLTHEATSTSTMNADPIDQSISGPTYDGEHWRFMVSQGEARLSREFEFAVMNTLGDSSYLAGQFNHDSDTAEWMVLSHDGQVLLWTESLLRRIAPGVVCVGEEQNAVVVSFGEISAPLLPTGLDVIGESMYGGTFPVSMDGKWGLFSEESSIIWVRDAVALRMMSADRVAAQHVSQLWGYVDGEGKWVIEPQFTAARVFFGRAAFVNVQGGSGKLIDRDGNTILEKCSSASTGTQESTLRDAGSF